MADDARTEARRRIADVLHAVCCGCPDYHAGPDEEDPIYEQQAAAVLGLFPHVDWQPWCMSHAVAVQYADRSDCAGLGPHDEGRQLVLHAGIDDLAFPVEPATKEPTDAR